MRFARCEDRVSISCQVAVRSSRGVAQIGSVIDLSAHGLKIELPARIPAGRRVEMLLDGPGLPDRELPALVGTVMSSAGRRIGVIVNLPEPLREHLRDVASPSAMVVVNADLVPTRSGVAREALYQAARAYLLAGRTAVARKTIARALAADPGNRCYLALLHLADAELALGRRRRGEALWAARKARACVPRSLRDGPVRARLAALPS